jgi:hypothetical protein
MTSNALRHRMKPSPPGADYIVVGRPITADANPPRGGAATHSIHLKQPDSRYSSGACEEY